MAGLLDYVQNNLPYRPPANKPAAPFQGVNNPKTGMDRWRQVAEEHGGTIPSNWAWMDAIPGPDMDLSLIHI